MRRVFLVIVFSIFTYYAYTQNLVRNGSFEEYTKCPKESSDCKVVKYWYQPTKGTTDYFNECATTKGRWSVSVPHNFAGYQRPHSGKGYIGMYFYDLDIDSKEDYREYFSSQLISPLIEGEKYKVQLWVCLAKMSERAVSNIDVLFSPDSIKKNTEDRLEYVPQLSYSINMPITDTANWTEISWVYTSKGNEQFITIGNFTKAKYCKVDSVRSKNQIREFSAYYYLEDVCISKIKDDSTCNCDEDIKKNTPKKIVTENDTITAQHKQFTIEINKSIVLNNVIFDNDKSNILPVSFEEMNQLIAYLQINFTAKIVISGYTDNTGDQEENLSLSQARAKAVADYLISKGINKLRVSYKGYGSANPIASNDTEEGKVKNRRVEFKIIEK